MAPFQEFYHSIPSSDCQSRKSKEDTLWGHRDGSLPAPQMDPSGLDTEELAASSLQLRCSPQDYLVRSRSISTAYAGFNLGFYWDVISPGIMAEPRESLLSQLNC